MLNFLENAFSVWERGGKKSEGGVRECSISDKRRGTRLIFLPCKPLGPCPK